MKSLKILVLVHHDCQPPADATVKQADWAHWKTEFHVRRTLGRMGHHVELFPVVDRLDTLNEKIKSYNPDLVFNLMEEFNSNPLLESHLVGYLEMLGVPYTGCNPLGLSLGRNKALSKQVLGAEKVLTPQFFVVQRGQTVSESELKFPLIVKSLTEEASMGIAQSSVVKNQKQLQERVRFIHEQIQTDALVEQYIKGRELYVGVLGNKNLKVLPPWELNFGDLKHKGHPIATRQVKFSESYGERLGIKRSAAKGLSEFSLKKIENTSRSIYKSLKLSGYARLDFRLTEDGELYFLEANPNPELARGECLANAAQHMGWDYSQLLGKIISLGRGYKVQAA